MRFAPRQTSNEPARCFARLLQFPDSRKEGNDQRERERDSYATTIPSQSECIVPLRGSHAPVSLRSRYYFHTNKGICVKDKQMRILRSIESKLKKRKKIKHFIRVNNGSKDVRHTCAQRPDVGERNQNHFARKRRDDHRIKTVQSGKSFKQDGDHSSSSKKFFDSNTDKARRHSYLRNLKFLPFLSFSSINLLPRLCPYFLGP